MKESERLSEQTEVEGVLTAQPAVGEMLRELCGRKGEDASGPQSGIWLLMAESALQCGDDGGGRPLPTAEGLEAENQGGSISRDQTPTAHVTQAHNSWDSIPGERGAMEGS